MKLTAVNALNIYLNNSLRTGDFSTLDFRKELSFRLKEPDIPGLESQQEQFSRVQDIPFNPQPVRNVFKNFGYEAKNNTENEHILMYGIAHVEPYSKAIIGDDIVLEKIKN